MFDVSSCTVVTVIWLPWRLKEGTADSQALPSSTSGFYRGCCRGGYSLLPCTFGIVAELGLLGLHFRSGLSPVIVGATATPAILLPQRIGSLSNSVLDRLSGLCHNCSYSIQGELSLCGGLHTLRIMLGVCGRNGLRPCPPQPVPRRRNSSTIRGRRQTGEDRYREVHEDSSEPVPSQGYQLCLMSQDPRP